MFFFDLLYLTVYLFFNVGVYNAVEQLFFEVIIENNVAQHVAVDLTIRQQDLSSKLSDNFPVGRQSFFDHIPGNAVGVNDNGACFF